MLILSVSSVAYFAYLVNVNFYFNFLFVGLVIYFTITRFYSIFTLLKSTHLLNFLAKNIDNINWKIVSDSLVIRARSGVKSTNKIKVLVVSCKQEIIEIRPLLTSLKLKS